MADTNFNLNIKPGGREMLADERPILRLDLSAAILSDAEEEGRALRVKEVDVDIVNRIRAHELRGKSEQECTEELNLQRKELATLRVSNFSAPQT